MLSVGPQEVVILEWLDGATVFLAHFGVLIDEPGRIATELAEGGPVVLALARAPQNARVYEKGFIA
jgi:hypothetical protein